MVVISALGKLFQASQGSIKKKKDTSIMMLASLCICISCIEANVMIDIVL